MTTKAWIVERDEHLAKHTAEAQYLVGKTISAVVFAPHAPECDGENVLRLTFSDGTTSEILGGYAGYTGNSCDEYLEFVAVSPAP